MTFLQWLSVVATRNLLRCFSRTQVIIFVNFPFMYQQLWYCWSFERKTFTWWSHKSSCFWFMQWKYPDKAKEKRMKSTWKAYEKLHEKRTKSTWKVYKKCMKSIWKAHEKRIKSAAFHDERPLARNWDLMFFKFSKSIIYHVDFLLIQKSVKSVNMSLGCLHTQPV